jgi:hypothetical protein
VEEGEFEENVVILFVGGTVGTICATGEPTNVSEGVHVGLPDGSTTEALFVTVNVKSAVGRTLGLSEPKVALVDGVAVSVENEPAVGMFDVLTCSAVEETVTVGADDKPAGVLNTVGSMDGITATSVVGGELGDPAVDSSVARGLGKEVTGDDAGSDDGSTRGDRAGTVDIISLILGCQVGLPVIELFAELTVDGLSETSGAVIGSAVGTETGKKSSTVGRPVTDGKQAGPLECAADSTPVGDISPVDGASDGVRTGVPDQKD